MSDTVFTTQSVAGGDTSIDNEAVVQAGGAAVKRQRVRIGGSTGALLAEVTSGGALLVSDLADRVTSTITATSGTPAAGATGLSDATSPPAANSTVVLTPTGDHSSWSVQVTGTWTGTMYSEVSMDGTVWVPVNSRQSAGGRLSNNWTTNGLFRGVFGGMFAMRVRAVGAFTGTATVRVSLGDDAAVFSNSDILTMNQPQYYASSAGLNTMWGVASPTVTTSGTANTEVPILLLSNIGTNPLYLFRLSMGCNNAAVWRRYRTPREVAGAGATTQMAHSSGGTVLTSVNRAGASVAATSGQARYGTNIVVTGQPAVPEKTIFTPAGGQDTSNEDGSIIIQTGQTLLFTVAAAVASSLAACEVVYWDGSSLT